MHAYRGRLPPTDQIIVETLHSGFSIARKVDLNTYSPPGRLRRCDLIFIDEASQITDEFFDCLIVGIRELPQKPFIVVAEQTTNRSLQLAVAQSVRTSAIRFKLLN